MARGHRLNASIVLAAADGLSGLFRVLSNERKWEVEGFCFFFFIFYSLIVLILLRLLFFSTSRFAGVLLWRTLFDERNNNNNYCYMIHLNVSSGNVYIFFFFFFFLFYC